MFRISVVRRDTAWAGRHEPSSGAAKQHTPVLEVLAMQLSNTMFKRHVTAYLNQHIPNQASMPNAAFELQRVMEKFASSSSTFSLHIPIPVRSLPSFVPSLLPSTVRRFAQPPSLPALRR
jgi:hypothetical protein